MAEKPKQWKSVRDDIHKWENVGETIEGVYRDVQEREIGDRTAKLYTLDRDGDRPLCFWGTTVINRQMERVPRGSWVQIVYRGEAGQGNRRYKDLEVKVGKGTDLLPAREEPPTPL